MIAHVSLPAANCAQVAEVLAEIMEGGAVRFPPGGPEAWNCWSKDNDFQIVVTPCGQLMVSGPVEQTWEARASASDGARAYECHFAIAVSRSALEVVSIASAVGWQARVCSRGGFFEVVEVWVENAFLVEVLDPAQLAAYRCSMTVANWKRAFGLS